MNSVEKQILENQLAIMNKFNLLFTNEAVDTLELIKPKENNESACDMSNLDKMDQEEDAFVSNEVSEK